MSFSIDWCWFTALLLCLQLMGGGADQNCTEEKNIQIHGGHYTLTNELRTNSKLLYHCPPNYYPYPALSRVCQTNGKWTPKPKTRPRQTCRLVECPDPTVLEQGSVYPAEQKYYVGNETTYDCWSGYTLRGSASRICQSNGKWSGKTPICSRNTDSTCADPGVPAGAVKVGNIYDIDEKVKYSCNNNLMLVGPSERVCQENGQWTGMEPACYYKHTYDTALEVSEAFGTSIKQSLTELQTDEDEINERKIRIPKNGTLNIYIAIDVSASITQDEFTQAKEAVIKLITKVSSFSVTPNYEILFFSSIIKEVVNINAFFGANPPSLDLVREEMKQFNIEEGTDDTGTDMNAAFTRIMERMAWIKQNTNKDFVEHRHVIIIFSDGGFNVGGSPKATVAKIKHMVYHNKDDELDEEKRKEYLDIYVFAIGSMIYDDELMPLTAPEGSPDKHYFRLAEIKNLKETFDDIIDEEEVVALCGLYIEKNNQTTKDWTAYKYPWNAEITIGTRNCLGSLVSSRFVLTAAHCIKFEDTPDKIKIYTGDKQGRNVDNITRHGLYNINKRTEQGVLEFYDYDVALLRLTEKVIFSSQVRPICIPCTQATSDALNLVGVSTCRQQEDLLLNKEIERLAFLSVKSKTLKEKDVHAKLGVNQRDDCIKQAKHAYGVTTDDAKLAVTDNFICTGGKSPKVDHISCPGDSGGAVFKEYERRIIQVAVVSWGVHDMCKLEDMPRSNKTSRDFHINLFRVRNFLEEVLGDEFGSHAPMKFLPDN